MFLYIFLRNLEMDISVKSSKQNTRENSLLWRKSEFMEPLSIMKIMKSVEGLEIALKLTKTFNRIMFFPIPNPWLGMKLISWKDTKAIRMSWILLMLIMKTKEILATVKYTWSLWKVREILTKYWFFVQVWFQGEISCL